MIAAILLLHLGLGLEGLRSAPVTDIIMVVSFWGGLILFAFVTVGMVVDSFRKPRSRNNRE